MNRPISFKEFAVDFQFVGGIEKPADIESFTDRYGHGECHALTEAIYEKWPGAEVVLLMSRDSGMAVHSFLAFGEWAVDAYGIRPYQNVIAQWTELAKVNEDGIIEKRQCDIDAVRLYSGADDEDVDEAWDNFSHVMSVHHQHLSVRQRLFGAPGFTNSDFIKCTCCGIVVETSEIYQSDDEEDFLACPDCGADETQLSGYPGAA